MRSRLFAMLAILFVGVTSCYDDTMLREQLADHEERIQTLETLCKQMNTNIESLQTIVDALQKNDYIKSVSPIKEGDDVIGYTIDFVQSGSITIYNGEDVHTPVIGVQKDADGEYYWTLDGEWLLDAEGNKIPTIGEDGKDGADGKPGQDGTDGITPLLKIEDEYWYVSYDNGVTWERLYKATGDNGEDGADGDSFFSGVDMTDPDFVIFTLVDGTEIKIPTWKAFEELQTIVNKVNTNLEAIQALVEALQNNDSVTSVEPLTENGQVIGYIINFSKSGPVVIYHGQDGKDGHTPVIGVQKDVDGRYYWTVDGEWLLDSAGNKIPTTGEDGKDGSTGEQGQTGITPQLKIEENYWYISYDNGTTWNLLGKAEISNTDMELEDILMFFSGINLSKPDQIVFTLSNGTEITLPRYEEKVEIEFNVVDGETTVKAGEKIEIKYLVKNGTESTIVTAGSDGNYKVRVVPQTDTTGVIEVICPPEYVDGYINITASNGNGYAYVKVISFCEKIMSFSSGYEYSINSRGGVITIPLTTNFGFTAKVRNEDSDWIRLIQTKASLRDDVVELSITKNNKTSARRGIVEIYAHNNPYTPYCEIAVNQASAVFSLAQTSFVAKSEGETISTTVTSTAGLHFKKNELPQWLNIDTSVRSDSLTYDISMHVAENLDSLQRNAYINCYAEDKATVLGQIVLIQLTDGKNKLRDLVFMVRANYANEFTSILPINDVYIGSGYDRYANVDCYVDWGDGTIEHITRHQVVNDWGGYDWVLPQVKHVYKGLTEGKTFEVRISGTLEALYTPEVDKSGIVEVVQWGNTGLKSISRAFLNNTSIKYLPSDNLRSFADLVELDDAFNGCASLETIPEDIFKYCTKVTDFSRVFSRCSNLMSIPGKLFANCTEADSFYSCFGYCSSLETVPDNLFANCTKVTNFASCFSECTNLKTVPERLFVNNTKVSDFSQCFYHCLSLEAIPEKLFANCKDVIDFGYCFWYCSSIKCIPVSLFDNNRKVVDFSGTFNSCHDLTGESPYTEINGVKYHLYERENAPDHFVKPNSMGSCFDNCWGLTDMESIPETWK